jgi:hypothetical protein
MSAYLETLRRTRLGGGLGELAGRVMQPGMLLLVVLAVLSTASAIMHAETIAAAFAPGF